MFCNRFQKEIIGRLVNFAILEHIFYAVGYYPGKRCQVVIQFLVELRIRELSLTISEIVKPVLDDDYESFVCRFNDDLVISFELLNG